MPGARDSKSSVKSAGDGAAANALAESSATSGMGTVPIFRNLKMGTVPWVCHRNDSIAGIQRRHRHADLARLLQRIPQRLLVLEPAAAQHVLLRRHAVLGR